MCVCVRECVCALEYLHAARVAVAAGAGVAPFPLTTALLAFFCFKFYKADRNIRARTAACAHT